MHIHQHAPRWVITTRPVIHHSSTAHPADATPMLSLPPLARNVGGRVNTPADYLSSSPSEEGIGALRILIPITTVAWVLVGASCILCINGKGRAGHWVPKWYLDSEGTRRDMAMVVAWWLAVLLLWPVILPALLVDKLVRQGRKAVVKMQKKRQQGHQQQQQQSDEESQTTEDGEAK